MFSPVKKEPSYKKHLRKNRYMYYVQLNHSAVHLRVTQLCKAPILQYKITSKNKSMIRSLKKHEVGVTANLNSICITSPHHLQSPLGSCLAKCTLSSLPDTSDSQVENSAIKCMTQIYQLSLGWQVYKQDMDSTEIDLGHFNL